MLNIRVELLNMEFKWGFSKGTKVSYKCTSAFGTILQADLNQKSGRYTFLVADDEGNLRVISDINTLRVIDTDTMK